MEAVWGCCCSTGHQEQSLGDCGSVREHRTERIRTGTWRYPLSLIDPCWGIWKQIDLWKKHLNIRPSQWKECLGCTAYESWMERITKSVFLTVCNIIGKTRNLNSQCGQTPIPGPEYIRDSPCCPNAVKILIINIIDRHQFSILRL